MSSHILHFYSPYIATARNGINFNHIPQIIRVFISFCRATNNIRPMPAYC